MPANAYLTPLEGRERVRQARESCQDVWDLDVKCVSCAKEGDKRDETDRNDEIHESMA